jgi:NAD(P)-dependent dehydrogenase (short-subunit alcohol dehydrogenase family)
MTARLDGKTALVTGATSNIGRAIAIAFCSEGAHVVVAGRNKERGDEVVDQIRSAGGHADFAAIDLDGSKKTADALADEATRLLGGRIDVLVNNAGTSAPAAPVQELSEADWRRVVDTNLTGSFLCAQAAFALMLRQDPKGGRIINNGSLSAHVPRPHAIAYTASKHAISGLTKALELEGRRHGITCGQIDIGNAATPMTRRMGQGVLQPDGSTAVEPTFDPRVVADLVVRVAQLPLDIAVPSLTVMAAGMPYVGRG